ncbi:hypothetical protein [Streptomyces sp. NPDC059928]|uniref:hypothetical protein n=1 Tax=unclassified Streptomyces TaxID=2593676 RepID=UPI0036698B0B
MIYVSDPALRKIALEAAEQVTTDIGRIHKDDLHEAICERLRQDEKLFEMTVQKAARGMARDLGERRSPRRHRKTGSLYHPASILRLGNGIWVWMKDATPTDMTQWGRLSSRNTVQIITAEAERQQYVLDRTDAFREYPDFERLAPLEESVFHYAQGTLDDLVFDEATAA